DGGASIGGDTSRVDREPELWCKDCDCFFFSSRRRHTSSVSAFLLNRSSDLFCLLGSREGSRNRRRLKANQTGKKFRVGIKSNIRSEERRVGKECKFRWAPYG